MLDLGRIDISMTSISSRLPALPQTLRSLLEQDYGNICIHLYLSKEGYLLDKGVPELSDEMVQLQKEAGERLKIHYVFNSGPYRKLLPYLRAHWGQSRLVATVDDDTIYPKDWLQTLLDAYVRYNCVIGYRGHQIKISQDQIAPYRSWMRSGVSLNPSPFILPTGKDGVLYNTAFFPTSVLNLREAMRIAPTVDDLWFRWNLAYTGISAYLINTDYRSDTFDETDYDGSLYLDFNMAGGNDKAVVEVDNFFSNNFDFKMSSLLQ